MNDVVNLDERFSRFTDQWAPKVVARINDYEVKVVRLHGEFVWHQHEDTDELFHVLEGELTIQLRGHDVALHAGEMFVVPRGVEHCPKADAEARVLLLEPVGVVNTGDAGGPITAAYEDLSNP